MTRLRSVKTSIRVGGTKLMLFFKSKRTTETSSGFFSLIVDIPVMSKERTGVPSWFTPPYTRSPNKGSYSYSLVTTTSKEHPKLFPLRRAASETLGSNTGNRTIITGSENIQETSIQVSVIPGAHDHGGLQIPRRIQGRRFSGPACFEPIPEASTKEEQEGTPDTPILMDDYNLEVLSYGNPLSHTCCVVFTVIYMVGICVIIILAYAIFKENKKQS